MSSASSSVETAFPITPQNVTSLVYFRAMREHPKRGSLNGRLNSFVRTGNGFRRLSDTFLRAGHRRCGNCLRLCESLNGTATARREIFGATFYNSVPLV